MVFLLYWESLSTIKLQENFSRIENRGPDYSILQTINDVTLGFHRLSINDLTETDDQPFINETYLICNGEIYNHKLLKKIQH